MRAGAVVGQNPGSGLAAVVANGLVAAGVANANGYLAESLPLEGAGNTAIMIAGTKYVMRVPIPGSITFGTVDFEITAAGSALTVGQSLMAVYNKLGTKLGTDSADQSTIWASTGIKSHTFGSSFTVDTCVYVEWVCGGGTTMPTIARGPILQLFNANITSPNANLRAATNGIGATATDASITPSALTGNNAPFAYWVGLR